MDTASFRYKVGSDAQLPVGILVGSAENTQAATGCTIILAPEGAACGVDVRGAAPATRESDLLRLDNMVQKVHAVILSGGSAFGLAAADGVMTYCEKKRIGFAFGGCVVPIVVGASLFDLGVGDGTVRPDAKMGYQACVNACNDADIASVGDRDISAQQPDTKKSQARVPSILTGRVGAGCGASVGKLLGSAYAMSGGLGACSINYDLPDGNLIVCALVAVNAVGNVVDATSERTLAGVIDPYGNGSAMLDPLSASALALRMAEQADAATQAPLAKGANGLSTNTTLGCIITNAKLDKCAATRVATMANDGYARALEPVHTSNDGDAIYCLSTNTISSHPDFIGMLAAKATEKAIHNAVVGSVRLEQLS